MKHLRVLVALVIIAVAAVLVTPSNHTQAQAVAQSYSADSPLQAGMIVQLADSKTKVKPVTSATAANMHGVVIRPNDAPLSLSEDKAEQEVYVATTGRYQVLVSDQNGAIKEGDYLVVSAIDGIAMRVNSAAQYVVGKSLQGFDDSKDVLSQTTVKDGSGNERTVKIGYVGTDINISRNPLYQGATSNVPGFLQRAVDSIAGKTVSPARVYLSAAMAIITGIIVSSILYAGIRTSLIALGRNPLARKGIFRGLFRVILLGLIILTGGLVAVYLLLKL